MYNISRNLIRNVFINSDYNSINYQLIDLQILSSNLAPFFSWDSYHG
jgi:hypothetical protein